MKCPPLILIVLLSLLQPASAQPANDKDGSPSAEPLFRIEQEMRQRIDDLEPSIVSVVVSTMQYDPLPLEEQKIPGRLGSYIPREGIQPGRSDPRDLTDPGHLAEHRFGSGIVLDADKGLILTSYHLIEGARKIYIRASDANGSYADIHAADARSDLAVLKVIEPLRGLKPVRFANVKLPRTIGDKQATVFRGMWVISMGHPLAVGFADGIPSASWGILSNVRRRAAGPGQEDARSRGLHHYGSLLQTDARVTLGCSGGGLFNLKGELVGITSPLAAVKSAESAGGFAIPMDKNYRNIIAALEKGREVEYGFLGIAIQNNAIEADGGYRITSITPGSPADRAGLRGPSPFSRNSGDVILEVNGQPIRDTDDLFLFIGSSLAEAKIKLKILRDGLPREIDLKLAKYSHPLPFIASVQPASPFGIQIDHSSVAYLEMNNAGLRFIDLEIPRGVAIRDLKEGSPGAKKLNQLGGDPTRWTITEVDGTPIDSPSEYRQAIGNKESVTLKLEDINPTGPNRMRTITLP